MVATDTPSSRRLQTALRRYSPSLVHVERRDNEPIDLRPTGNRGKWMRIIEALPDDAERVEFRDAKGAVLWALTLDRDDDDEAPASQTTHEVAQLLQLVIAAQDKAVARHGEQVVALTRGYTDLAQILASRLASMERTFGDVMKLAYESTVAAGQAEASSTSASSDALVGQVLQLAGPMLAAQKKGA